MNPIRWRSLIVVLMALLLGLAGGCVPREQFPHQASKLLPSERESVRYRRLVLPNGLKAILVSNPNASLSAAALAVGVGSLANPEDRPGLAHFLEHMLFLGTKKYPQAGEFSRFMSANAGSSNAYTADDHTNYFFEISPQAFEEGLDRFAHFFIDPLLDDTYAEREMKAVDSEHAKNVESDYWRVHQVQRLQYKPNHPISRFFTGNLSTLKGVGREELEKFYRNNYSSNRMTLSVVGNRSLDALEKMVRARFERIPNRSLQRFRVSPDYLSKQEALRVLRIVPVADLRQVTLHFPLPAVVKNFEAKPLAMISAILGHEGKGSLLSLLKADGLVATLSAGAGDDNLDYASLEITAGLTVKGLKQFREVIAKVMGTISALRKTGIPRRIFEERKTMAGLEVRYRSVPASSNLARRLASMMQKYPLEALPDQPFLLKAYAPDLYQAILAHLTADNMLVTLVAKDLPTPKTEPYYKAKYGYEKITGEAYQAISQATPDRRWRLPESNPFIPEQIKLIAPRGPLKFAAVSLRYLERDRVPPEVMKDLRPLQGHLFDTPESLIQKVESKMGSLRARRWLPVVLKDALPLPQTLLDTPQAKVWWLADWRLRQPKAEMVLKFYVDGAYKSPREAMLGQLYEALIEEELNELGYPIKEAGLHYSINSVKGGIAITLGGYSARMLDLLQVLVGRLSKLRISQESFSTIHEGMVRGLENRKLDQPYHQATYFGQMILETPNFTHEALLRSLRELKLSDVKGYAQRFLGRTYLEGVVVGNLSQEEARIGIRKALATLKAGVLPIARRTTNQVRLMPQGADWIYSRKIAINNSVGSLVYSVGETDPSLRGALLIIGKPLGQRFYFLLRTRQQLGYIVWAGVSQVRKKLFLNFLVQSGQHSADDLLERIEGFIPEFIAHFKGLPSANFERFRRAVIQAKLERDKSLATIANRLFWMAFRNDEQFDYVSRDIAAVEKLTREEVEAVLTRVLTTPKRSRLAIRLTGSVHSSRRPKGEVVGLPVSVHPDGG